MKIFKFTIWVLPPGKAEKAIIDLRKEIEKNYKKEDYYGGNNEYFNRDYPDIENYTKEDPH